MAQVLPTTYSERDVRDVESYVRGAVDGVSGYLSAEEHERLVARGILLVRRIASALPPGASLEAVLRDHLTPALDTYRWREARTTRDQAPVTTPRAA
jgi:hypothetical protein